MQKELSRRKIELIEAIGKTKQKLHAGIRVWHEVALITGDILNEREVFADVYGGEKMLFGDNVFNRRGESRNETENRYLEENKETGLQYKFDWQHVMDLNHKKDEMGVVIALNGKEAVKLYGRTRKIIGRYVYCF